MGVDGSMHWSPLNTLFTKLRKRRRLLKQDQGFLPKEGETKNKPHFLYIIVPNKLNIKEIITNSQYDVYLANPLSFKLPT